MNRIVSVILTLSRCESGKQTISPAAHDIKHLILKLWEPWQKMADKKEIKVNFNLGDGTGVMTDKAMISSILTNLFSSAVEHCQEGGHIFCNLTEDSHTRIFILINSDETLTEDDLFVMFEPLWRKDKAKSSTSHSGLGLVIVQTFARHLGIEIKTQLLHSEDFCVTLVIPPVLPGIS